MQTIQEFYQEVDETRDYYADVIHDFLEEVEKEDRDPLRYIDYYKTISQFAYNFDSMNWNANHYMREEDILFHDTILSELPKYEKLFNESLRSDSNKLYSMLDDYSYDRDNNLLTIQLGDFEPIEVYGEHAKGLYEDFSHYKMLYRDWNHDEVRINAFMGNYLHNGVHTNSEKREFNRLIKDLPYRDVYYATEGAKLSEHDQKIVNMKRTDFLLENMHPQKNNDFNWRGDDYDKMILLANKHVVLYNQNGSKKDFLEHSDPVDYHTYLNYCESVLQEQAGLRREMRSIIDSLYMKKHPDADLNKIGMSDRYWDIKPDFIDYSKKYFDLTVFPYSNTTAHDEPSDKQIGNLSRCVFTTLMHSYSYDEPHVRTLSHEYISEQDRNSVLQDLKDRNITFVEKENHDIDININPENYPFVEALEKSLMHKAFEYDRAIEKYNSLDLNDFSLRISAGMGEEHYKIAVNKVMNEQLSTRELKIIDDVISRNPEIDRRILQDHEPISQDYLHSGREQ